MATLIPKYSQVNTANRTIAQKFAETISVKDYGAVGDGTTDDTNAIQAAYNAVATATVSNAPLGGATVIFPAGTYKITSAISIVNDNVHTIGQGAAIVPTHTGNVYEVGPASETRQFVVFDSIAVKPNSSTNDIIRFNSATHECKVINCRFEGTTGTYTTGYGVNFNASTVAFNNNDVIDGTYFRWLKNGVKFIFSH